MKKLLLLALLIVPMVCFAQKNEANKLIESGIQKVFDDKFDEALIDFNQALEKDQKGSIKHKIYFERAQLKRREFKDFNGALKDYTSSIKFNPKYIRAYLYRGLLYERNFSDPEAAERDYRKSIAYDSECGACWMQLGYLSERLSSDEMLEATEKALKYGISLQFDGKFAPPFPLYGRLANIKSRDDDYLGAIESYQRLIDNYQEFDSDGDGEMDETAYLDGAYESISRIQYYVFNDSEKALENINKAIEINPDNKDYFTLRAEIKYKNEDIEGALEDYLTAKKTINKTYFNNTYNPSSYYPYKELHRNLDSIKLPITVNTRIEVSDILGLDTTNDQFFMAVNYNVYSKLGPKFINYKKDTLTLFNLEKRISPFYVSSD